MRDAIIDAVNQNRIEITDLISKSSAELLGAVGKVKEDTVVLRAAVQRIETLFEKGHPTPSEPKRSLKPSRFRGESSIFVGRKVDIETAMYRNAGTIIIGTITIEPWTIVIILMQLLLKFLDLYSKYTKLIFMLMYKVAKRFL
jgi:hypothetical protein